MNVEKLETAAPIETQLPDVITIQLLFQHCLDSFTVELNAEKKLSIRLLYVTRLQYGYHEAN